MPHNWVEWHERYKTEESLQQRLGLVQEYISFALNARPTGKVKVVSICAGDGRDLLGVLTNHPRNKDVYARLVDLNSQLVERGRATLEKAGLETQIEFVNGDATLSSNYASAVPADIVLFCGIIFGKLVDEVELKRLLGNLKFIAKTGAFLIWTYSQREGIVNPDIVRKQLQLANFEEVDFRLTTTGNMGVGLHRYVGETAPLPPNYHLFTYEKLDIDD